MRALLLHMFSSSARRSPMTIGPEDSALAGCGRCGIARMPMSTTMPVLTWTFVHEARMRGGKRWTRSRQAAHGLPRGLQFKKIGGERSAYARIALYIQE